MVQGQIDDRATMIARKGGTFTCNVEEADELLREAWLPIFQQYRTSLSPSWGPSWARPERFGGIRLGTTRR